MPTEVFFHDDFRVSSKLTPEPRSALHGAPLVGPERRQPASGWLRPHRSQPLRAGQGWRDVRGCERQSDNVLQSQRSSSVRARWLRLVHEPEDRDSRRYGIFWAPGTTTGFTALGYSQTTDYISTNDGGYTPANSLGNPFPEGLLQPVGMHWGLATGVGQSISFIDREHRLDQSSAVLPRRATRATRSITFSAGCTSDRTPATSSLARERSASTSSSHRICSSAAPFCRRWTTPSSVRRPRRGGAAKVTVPRSSVHSRSSAR